MFKNLIKLIFISIIVLVFMIKIQNTDIVTDKNITVQLTIERIFKKYFLDTFNDLTLTKND
jgi:uncharacterized membrane protein